MSHRGAKPWRAETSSKERLKANIRAVHISEVIPPHFTSNRGRSGRAVSLRHFVNSRRMSARSSEFEYSAYALRQHVEEHEAVVIQIPSASSLSGLSSCNILRTDTG